MGAIWALVGPALLVIGVLIAVFTVKKQNRYRKEGRAVTARITGFLGMPNFGEQGGVLGRALDAGVAMRQNRGDMNQRPIISWEIDGKEYKAELTRSSTHMRIGRPVKIYVSNEDPNDFVEAGIGQIVLGGVLAVVGVIVMSMWFGGTFA